MSPREIIGAAAAFNLCSVGVAMRNPRRFRRYLSNCLRKYDEDAGQGLPHADPISFVAKQGWGRFAPEDRVELPTMPRGTRSASAAESLILATATRVLGPEKVFEIGTFDGCTTTLFILNSPPGAEVITLDLPPANDRGGGTFDGYLEDDVDAVMERQLGSYSRALGLEGRYRQILCNSMEFDPEPHRDTVELGFIDGAHTYDFVKGDTEKMAVMVAERGLVFWHDYGGQGSYRPLASYLEALGRRIPVHRIRDTSLAWASARDLRSIRP
jgi:hypothetical protein